MGIPQRPKITRLRWVSASGAETIERFTSRLGMRIQIYSINRVGSKWFLWFVPDDLKDDVQSGELPE